VASINKRKTASGTSYDVRYRDPHRRPRKKTFARKIDADRFAATVEADLVRGDWLDPRRGRRHFGEWAEDWFATKNDLKPATLSKYRNILDKHLLPSFGAHETARIEHGEVASYLAGLTSGGMSASRVRSIRNVMKGILDLAVRSSAVKLNPADGIRIAADPRREYRYLSASEVELLAEEISQPPVHVSQPYAKARPEFGLLVRFAAFTGLRQGELLALRVRHLDFMRRKVTVHESASEVSGTVHLLPTKTNEVRSVPIPGALVDDLMAWTAGRDQDAFVWPNSLDGPMRASALRSRHFKPAAKRCGLDGLRFHDLRHTCAALLIAQDAHPKSIQQWLGHSQITVTLDTYGHLFPAAEEALADRLDAHLFATERYEQAKAN